jgi:hypothetical protein
MEVLHLEGDFSPAAKLDAVACIVQRGLDCGAEWRDGRAMGSTGSAIMASALWLNVMPNRATVYPIDGLRALAAQTAYWLVAMHTHVHVRAVWRRALERTRCSRSPATCFSAAWTRTRQRSSAQRARALRRSLWQARCSIRVCQCTSRIVPRPRTDGAAPEP